MKLRLSDLRKIKSLGKIYKLAKERKTAVYLVGGTLRDCFSASGSSGLDFDFAVESSAVSMAKEISRKLKAPYVLLNEPHGCARVICKDKNKSINLDFSDFRAKTIEGDLAKRDFTIDALAVKLDYIFSPKTREINAHIIDPYGGRRDLKKKILRLAGRDNFKDDPLRLLRAFSLSARLDLKIEKTTLARIKKEAKLISNSAAERVREELFKIFSCNDSYFYLRELEQSGLLAGIIPEIKSMYRLKQGGYHHLDVWKHSLETFEKLEGIINKPDLPNKNELKIYLSSELPGAHKRSELIKFAALLHDVGKPPTFRVVKGKVHFYGHERVGAKIAEGIFTRLKLSSKEIKVLKLLIYWHLRPGYMSDIANLSKRALFRFFRDCNEESVSVALLSLADQRATRGNLKNAPERLRHEKLAAFLVREFFKRAKEEKPLRLITGDDIMGYLKIEPGPIVGRILNEINEAQAEGLISNKSEALAWAKKFRKKLGDVNESVQV